MYIYYNNLCFLNFDSSEYFCITNFKLPILKGEIYNEFQNEQKKICRKNNALGAFGDECIDLDRVSGW